VFAVPGSIRNPMARGCHRLLRDGATLVEDPAEVVAALGPVAQSLADALRSRLQTPIQAVEGTCAATADPSTTADPDYHRLWSALGHDPSPMDQLLDRTGLTAAEVSSMLLLMELDGRVVQAHGRYARKS
jgi:DNA processing protein